MVFLLLDLQRATHATLHRLTTDLADLKLAPSELNALANLARFVPAAAPSAASSSASSSAAGPSLAAAASSGAAASAAARSSSEVRLSSGARTVSELGAAAGTRPTTLTSILDRLEQRGLVRREPHAHDRRTVLVRLTPAGARVGARILEAMATLEQRALATLPTTAADNCAAVLRALTEAAS